MFHCSWQEFFFNSIIQSTTSEFSEINRPYSESTNENNYSVLVITAHGCKNNELVVLSYENCMLGNKYCRTG